MSSCVMVILVSLDGVKKLKLGRVLPLTRGLHWEVKRLLNAIVFA